MADLLFRRRLASTTAALMLAGLVFAPVATSHGGGPQGGPPGQGNKQGPGPGQGPPSQSPGDHGAPSQLPAAHGVPSLPPGQAKKHAPAPPPDAGNRGPNPGSLPPGQAKKVAGSAGNAGHSVTRGSSDVQAQPNRTSHRTAKVPPGQAKKQDAPNFPVTTPPSVSVTPTRAGVATAPAAPASTPPARRTTARHRPGARHVSTQRTSARHGRGRGGRIQGGGGTASSGRRLSRAGRFGAGGRAGHPATGANSPASRAGTGSPRSAHSTARLSPQPTGHKAGPISNLIGNLIPVPLPVPDWSKPIILALLLICTLLGLRAWLTGRRAGRLESQRGRLAADLASLQPALVPEIPARFGPLAVSVAYRPADGPAAGGDFYDVFGLGMGRVAVIVGDVSGHGRAALTRAAHMRYMLRAYVETGLDPRSALKLAGRVLGADKDALFATVGIAVYDPAAATLTYATAGHPPPLLYGAATHEPLSSCASPALGWGEPTGRRQTTVPFPEGAHACFFSDGVTEVRMMDGLLGRGRLADELELSGSAAALLERVQRQARTIRDDMAACIISAQAGTAISEHRIDEFEVELRHLESGQGDRFLAECGVPADDAAATLAQARLIAAESGAALIRAELTGHAATASVGGSEPVSLASPPTLAPADRGDGRAPAGRGWGSEPTVGRTTTVVNEPPLD